MVSSLHEKCPNTEFFLVSIFSYSLHTFHVVLFQFIMAVYYKMRQTLLQNVTAILLQNATKVYYKMLQRFITKSGKLQFYYKMR